MLVGGKMKSLSPTLSKGEGVGNLYIVVYLSIQVDIKKSRI
jgi:hypothetical protein